ncbi:MAG: SH3 domain-containing protein [Lachnospiraceae bacterium]|nr:SH3 domain-containing protein [Lachnospiraceae bacterium]
MQKTKAYYIERGLLFLLMCVMFGYVMQDRILSVSAAASGVINTTGGSLRVRNAPDGEPIGSLAKGASVTIIEEENGWMKITYADGYGYVSAAYVQKVVTDEKYQKELLAEGFPESYVLPLTILHQEYPNWEFVAWNTGLDWTEAVKAEAAVGKNTVAGNSISSFKSVSKGAYDLSKGTWVSFDSGGWVSASEEVIAYYMDSRNFLDADYIFQFMDQTYQSKNQTEKGLTTVVENSFLNTKEYKDSLMKAAKQSGVSPYVLASMIMVEQGKLGIGKSISGIQPGYKGYYNYYNIGAYATSSMTAVQRGLWYAKGGSTNDTSYNRPWNSREKAIIGGAIYYGNNYVEKGQTTLYLKKFNVQGKEKYSHQYMTNVQAAATEGCHIAKAYNKITDGKLSFKIPLYNNMPEENAKKPTGNGNPNNYLKNLLITDYKFAPIFRSYEQKYSLIVAGKVKEINIQAEAYNSKTVVSGSVGTIRLQKGMNKAVITATAENGLKRDYIIYIYRGNSQDADFDNTEEGVITPTTKPPVTMTPRAEVSPEPEPTKETQNPDSGVTGDVNGDGKVTVMDLLKVRKAILGSSNLSKEEEKRADMNGNGRIDIVDLLRIQKTILGIE